MTNTESETANKAEYLKARLHDTAASGATAFVTGATAFVTLAIMVAAQIAVAALGVALWLIKTL